MIRIRVSIAEKEKLEVKVRVDGHAGYAERGKDIVCAAVSMVTMQLANYISHLSEQDDDVEIKRMILDEDNGHVMIRYAGSSYAVQILTDITIMSFSLIEATYPDYISFNVKS